jgi:hypothetical protein
MTISALIMSKSFYTIGPWCRENLSSLDVPTRRIMLGPFTTYEENEVFGKWPYAQFIFKNRHSFNLHWQNLSQNIKCLWHYQLELYLKAFI